LTQLEEKFLKLSEEKIDIEFIFAVYRKNLCRYQNELVMGTFNNDLGDLTLE